MDIKSLVNATLVGTALQVALVVAGHFFPPLRDPGFAIGGMGFSAVAGWIHARHAGGWGDALGGGAIAGGVCAAIGIAVSVAFGDVPPSLLLVGTAGSVVTGLAGAAIAQRLSRGR